MYSITLTVYEVMSLWCLRGSVLQHLDNGEVSVVASFAQDYDSASAFPNEDDVTSMLRMIRQWADRTIQG